MNKIFSVLLLLTFSFIIISCSNSEDSSGATLQLGQVLDQPNSTDDRNSIDLPVIIFDSCNFIDNSTIDNSTVDKSSISDNSGIKDSTVKNCSIVTRSIVDNSSTIDNSTIDDSSTIDNSTINSSTIDNSTISYSTINNSSVCDSTFDNATVDNSIVCYDNVSFLIENKTIRNQIMTEQMDPEVGSVGITSVSERDYSVLNAGDNVSVTVTFNESVIITDDDGIGVDNASSTPTLILAVGSDNPPATYVSGDNSTALVFQYMIKAEDNDTDGISIDNDSLALNSGTIRDASGNYAKITHSDNNSSYRVDNTAPTLFDNVSITSSNSSSFWNESRYSHVLSVTAFFNEEVIVDNASGPLTLTITIGQDGTPPGANDYIDRKATFSSGNGTSELVFKYAIQSGDQSYFDGDGVSIPADSLSLDGDDDGVSGTIKDLAGHDSTNQVGTTLTHLLTLKNGIYLVK